MKKELEENVRITQTAFWIEGTGKENMFFSFVVPFLCLFFAVAGLTGSFISALSIQTVPFLIYGLLFLMSIFWTAFDRLKLDGTYRFLAFIAVMVVASILLLFMQGKAIDGFFQIANGIFESLNESYHSDIVLYQVSVNAMNASIFLLFVLFPITGLLSFSIVGKQNIWSLVAVVFPILFGSCLISGKPGTIYLFLLFFAFLILLAEGAVQVPYEHKYQEIRSKGAVGILLPALILCTVSMLLLKPVLVTPVYQIRDAGSKTENGVLQFVWKALPGISGGKMQMQLEGVGGGVDEGALGKTEGYYFGSVQALKLTCEERPTETLYLKGYIGSVYTGNSFDTASEEALINASSGWKTEGNALLYIQNLPFLRMMYAENVTVSGEDGEDIQMAEELQSSAVELKVENLNANMAYTYVPYNAFLNDYYEMLAGDGAVAGQTRADDIFSYYPISAYEEKMTDWQENEEAHGVLDSMAASYESYVNGTYLQIPETGLEQLQAECEAAELEDIEEIKEYVVKSLTENTSFQMDVESLPEGKDFVSWFYYEKKEGYSTHYAATATMMFRMFGIPARYVVGYVAPEELFSMQPDGSYEATLEDDNAHAWTEIYVSGIGWMPVETTPGFVATVTEGSADLSSAGVVEDAEESGEEDDEKAGETQQSKEAKETADKEKSSASIGQILLFICIGVIGITVLVLVVRRDYLRKKRTGRWAKRSTTENIKYLYQSFRSLLVFDGWEDAPGCESDEFAVAFAKKYKICSEEDFETFRNIILKTYYGYDKRRKKELQFIFAIYKRIGQRVYKKLSFGKRMKFLWWKCYL